MLHRLFLGAFLVSTFLLAGCEWTRDMMKPDKVDYKSEAQAQAKSSGSTLEIPPDLTKPKVGDRYSVSADGTSKQSVSIKDLPPPSTGTPVDAPTEVLTPVADKDMHIERAGTERWLVLPGKPDLYWDTIKQFWQEGGFVLTTDKPELGVMETDWAEKRAKLPSGYLGKLVSSVFDNLSSTPERDKFRTRLEVNSRGQTEVYISHRGLEEIYPNEARDQTVWQPRPSDPELEAEFLRRLMIRLGADEASVKAKLAAADKPVDPRAKMIKEGQYSMLVVDDNFDRAWRRIGLALDRVGFTVEDRDRSKGVFFVRYADPDAVATKKEKEGFFSKMTSWFNQDKSKPPEQYQIKVSDAAPSTRVAVLTKAGAPEENQTTRRILALLQDDLK